MQNSRQVSLNGVRIFALVAETRSIKQAAQGLGVTPGAVSRQIRNLELTMGVSLFERGNNTISLTPAGETFFQHSHPALHSLDRSIAFAMSDGRELSILASTTLATRWLIPRLHAFRNAHPDIIVKVETSGSQLQTLAHRADLSLGYVPLNDPLRGAEILFQDMCRPYVSPRLLSGDGSFADFTHIPALRCTDSNWDWELWLRNAGLGAAQLDISGQFDLDDAAIRAAIAGLGMVLSSEFIIQDDLEAGTLCAVPNTPSVLLGHYTLTLTAPASHAANVFAKWLRGLR